VANRRTLCPDGRREVGGPWIERGGRNPDGSTWHTCVCGFVHTRPALQPYVRPAEQDGDDRG
jgi:hypothetical protein